MLLLPRRVAVKRFVHQLSKRTRMSAVRAVADGCVVAVTMKRRGVRPLLSGLGNHGDVIDPLQARRVAQAVDAGLGLVPARPTCLRRSLVLLRELRRFGLDATLHIGVRNENAVVLAHAWIQVGDEVVNDDRAITDRFLSIAAGELEVLLPRFT